MAEYMNVERPAVIPVRPGGDPVPVVARLVRLDGTQVRVPGPSVRYAGGTHVGTPVEVRDLNVRTAQVAAGRAGQTVGFTGMMTPALARTSPPHTQLLLGVLGAAAEFLGVGKQTTFGFGVVTGQAQ